MDIPISELLEQYTKVIEEWRSLDLEITSEFLEMAARLVYIKTVMLLPKHDEAEQLRQELSGELMEYQLCKEMPQSFRAQHRRGYFCPVPDGNRAGPHVPPHPSGGYPA